MRSALPHCHHCGDACRSEAFQKEEKSFCCNGCLTVYELLSESGLDGFYADTRSPGVRIQSGFDERYAYLDEPRIQEMLLLFHDGEQSKVRLHLPTIHCSSCLWLLEHLGRLNKGILGVRVNFAKRQALISFDSRRVSLRELAETLHRIGYPPQIALSTGDEQDQSPVNKSLVLKIGITGFLFGNIMLLSFPEYFSTGTDLIEGYRGFFSYLILGLSLPVLIYGAREFFQSSIVSFRHRRLTIDVPIAIGITVIFLRSVYDIVTGSGPGYLDSMAGLVFFLLIGRWYQSKVYDSLSFDRDFRSFFPLSVLRKQGESSINVPVMELEVQDRIEVLNQGIIPADCELISDKLKVDYSFVTGESRPVQILHGESIYAGGKNLSGRVELRVKKKVSQSYLTDLWNRDAFQKTEPSLSGLLDRLSGRFTMVVLSIAVLTAVYWYVSDQAILMDAVTAVLIVACPCALALSVPFALGNSRRYLSKHGLFAKSTQVIEQIAKVDTIVFDKTGTLTDQEGTACHFIGGELSEEQRDAVAGLVMQSSHPHSLKIQELLGMVDVQVEAFTSIEGKGLIGEINGLRLKLGSSDFVGVERPEEEGSSSWLSIDGVVIGRFEMIRNLRIGMAELILTLKEQYEVILLSGDNDAEASLLLPFFNASDMYFEQSPSDKLNFIHRMQSAGKRVMMIGDGLNDAGALQQADIGIALADDVSQFTPACDAILQGAALQSLPQQLAYARKGIAAVHWSIGFSLLYNVIGVSFAVQGLLTPLIAAILMPLSSVTVVGFATLLTSWRAKVLFNDGSIHSHGRERSARGIGSHGLMNSRENTSNEQRGQASMGPLIMD